MRAVGVRALKNQLSAYVRLAAAGEVILVTDRERVVAELVPPREGRSELARDAMLADAVRKGWLSPPLGDATGRLPRRPVGRLEDLLGGLGADRADPFPGA
jgi:antitoxin (DNA-binding transcriptional repressor) of toxin-antitoxin stability system